MRQKIIILLTAIAFLCSSTFGVDAAPKKKRPRTETKTNTIQVVPAITKKKPRQTKIQKLEQRVAALEQVFLLLVGANVPQQEAEEDTTEKEPPMSEEVSHMYT